MLGAGIAGVSAAIEAARLGRSVALVDATPMLGGFKPPGVVYYAGHPLATMEDRASLVRRVQDEGAIVTALYERLGFRTTHDDERKFYMRRDRRIPH